MASANGNPNLPNIQSTGARGYLQWLRADQPGLYERVLPVLRAQAPQLWSDAVQTSVMTNLGRLAGSLGQDGDGDDDDDSGDDSGDDEGESDDEELAEAQTDLMNADSANTTAIDPTTAGTVSTIVGDTLSESDIDSALSGAISQVSDSQLANASAGLPPAATGTGGIGQAFSSLTSGIGSTGVVIGIGALLLLVAVAAG
jgi:hypothetical protein